MRCWAIIDTNTRQIVGYVHASSRKGAAVQVKENQVREDESYCSARVDSPKKFRVMNLDPMPSSK